MADATYRITVDEISLGATPAGSTVALDGGRQAEIVALPGGSYRIFCGRQAEIVALPGGSYRIFLGQQVLTGYAVAHDPATKTLTVAAGGYTFACRLQDRLDQVLEKFGLGSSAAAKVADLKAPMPGLVRRILVQPGQAVEKGTPLLVLEAMKMENMIKAQAPATVGKIAVAEGDKVEKGAVLIGF